MCPTWIFDFDKFFEDVGPRPSDKHSIDRIDNDGGYEAGNVRWSTREEQQNNLRSNHLVTHPVTGETKSVAQWAREAGISGPTMSNRILAGWPIEIALTQPLGSYKQRRQPAQRRLTVTIDGVERLALEVAKENGICQSTFHSRIYKLWPPLDACTKPVRIRRTKP